MLVCRFFFVKQKTAYEMRISDWSSDVCSSDLRTCRARLFGGPAAGWFLFFGYQLFIILAATGYLAGITQGREYAEPEWYTDLWLTIVWVVYLVVFVGTLMKREEPHIYVANWFFVAFIVTLAMLHIVNKQIGRAH